MRMGVVGGPSDRNAEEGRVCSVAWQRQHIHHQQLNTRTSIKQTALGGQTLPVVELRPFTKRVWRREHSLPTFPHGVLLKVEGPGVEPPREAGISSPPNILRYTRDLQDHRKTLSARHSVESTQRYRGHTHPKADFSFQSRSMKEHKQDLIPSFAPRQERTKTTVGDDGGGVIGMSAGSSACVLPERGVGQDTASRPPHESSNLMAAYTRDKPLHQQPVCLMGDKLLVNKVNRQSINDLQVFSAHNQNAGWNLVQLDSYPDGMGTRHHLNMSLIAKGRAMVPTVSGDHLMPHDLVLPGSWLSSADKSSQQAQKEREKSPHKFNKKLGAAQDAFLVLNRTGAPTVVERALSFEHGVRLERCRRERSFAAVSDPNTVVHASHHVTFDSQPTPGELTIMKAREANKPQDGGKVAHRRNGLQKPSGLRAAFVQQHFNHLTERNLDINSTHKKVEIGEYGEPFDSVVHLGESATTFPRLSEQANTQIHSNDCDRDVKTEWGQRSDLSRKWGPGKTLPFVPSDAESLVESTDENYRPLSETAATETIYVRNEMTPMSADNRARLLPKENSFLTMETERISASYRQRITGIGDRTPVHNGILTSQEGSDRQSGAIKVNKDTAINQSNGSSRPPSSLSKHDASRKKEKEYEQVKEGNALDSSNTTSSSVFKKTRGNTITTTSPDSASAVDSGIAMHSSPSVTAVSTQPHADLAAGQLDEKQKVTDGVPSSANEGKNIDNFPNCTVLDSGHSPAPSHTTTNNDTKSDSPTIPKQKYVTENNPGELKEPESENRNLQDGISRSGLVPDTGAGTTAGVQPSHKQLQMSTDEHSPLQAGSHDALAGNTVRKDEHSLVTDLVADQQHERAEKDGVLDKQDKYYQQHCPPLRHDSPKSQVDIKDSDSTDSQQQDPRVMTTEMTSQQISSPVRSDKDTQISDSLTVSQTVSSTTSGLSQDDRASRDVLEHSVKETDSENVKAEDEEPPENSVSNGIETMVTVTMETTEAGDVFDGSKTFLTTSNVEAAEWTDLVK